MRSLRLLVCHCIVAGALVVTVHSTVAAAAGRVLVLDRTGGVHARIDPALPSIRFADGAPLARPAELAPRVSATTSATRRPRTRTVRSELKRLRETGDIDAATEARYRRAFDDAVRTTRRLSGLRRSELQAVISNLHDIAARGQLTATRLPALFTTLERNRQWWTSGSLLSYGQRVEFSDSELVWEYYPGEGIELQVLGTFGKANALWSTRSDRKLRALLDELLPLAAERGGALAWEYYFHFGGGTPPWTSGMAQATGIQALARAGQTLGEPVYLEAARSALRLLALPAPVGVRVTTPIGARYLLYSFAPSQIVVNASVQTLVALHDYAEITSSSAADRLFRAGDRQARLDVRASDTGAWSLYQLGGAESNLSYHELLTGFLRNLCDRTRISVYCTTATDYQGDLKEPPTLELLTRRLRAHSSTLVRFELSKVSHVGMTIRREQDDKVVLATSASVSRGVHSYGWRVPRSPGTYDVTLSGIDLAGNAGRASGTIEVLPARRDGRRAPV
ncbi:MAG TPA: D-glucuronyl C5-epimerase family protein [Conexibacter sp.]|nr:D-glucuronyl C5-epimerase family protein [Conexibacter sp.]